MAILADRFELADGAKACIAALADGCSNHWQSDWEVLMDCFVLPPGLAALPDAGRLLWLAQHRLLTELRDLEGAIRLRHNALRLVRLPFEALTWLLRSNLTSAAYESTAIAAASLWVRATEMRLPDGQALAQELRRQLALCLRLCYVQPTYLATVVPLLRWLEGAVSKREPLLVAGGAGRLAPGCLEPSLGAAWLLAQPRLPVPGPPTGEWQVSEAQLREAYGSGAWMASPALTVVGGFQFGLQVAYIRQPEGGCRPWLGAVWAQPYTHRSQLAGGEPPTVCLTGVMQWCVDGCAIHTYHVDRLLLVASGVPQDNPHWQLMLPAMSMAGGWAPEQLAPYMRGGKLTLRLTVLGLA